MARMIILGKITGLFGVRGWLKVHSETVPRDNIYGYKQWSIQMPNLRKAGREGRQVDEQWQTMELEEGRSQGKTVVVKLRGIEDRETASTLVGATVAVERSQLPTLDEGEFYWTDLIGFDVLDTSGESLGTVQRLFATGANDVMVVEGDAEILIPWVRDSVIKSVDMEVRTVQVDWDPDY